MGFLRRRFFGERQTELEAISENLRHLLEARRGSSAYFPDFGLSEPTHRSAEEGVLRFTEEIESTIARYEPRVRVVEIEESYGEDDRPRLEVHLVLRATGERVVFFVDPLERDARPVPEPPEELEP